MSLAIELVPGAGVVPVNTFSSISYGPFLYGDPSEYVFFELTNNGNKPLNVNYSFENTDLFALSLPAAAGQFFLDVAETYFGAIKLNNLLVDQEIQDMIFSAVEGPVITVSLRSQVLPSSYVPPVVVPTSATLTGNGDFGPVEII
jgi:hypothetical protein